MTDSNLMLYHAHALLGIIPEVSRQVDNDLLSVNPPSVPPWATEQRMLPDPCNTSCTTAASALWVSLPAAFAAQIPVESGVFCPQKCWRIASLMTPGYKNLVWLQSLWHAVFCHDAQGVYAGRMTAV